MQPLPSKESSGGGSLESESRFSCNMADPVVRVVRKTEQHNPLLQVFAYVCVRCGFLRCVHVQRSSRFAELPAFIVILQRVELGKSKNSTYDIPNEGFVFGRPNIHDGEGASEGELRVP